MRKLTVVVAVASGKRVSSNEIGVFSVVSRLTCRRCSQQTGTERKTEADQSVSMIIAWKTEIMGAPTVSSGRRNSTPVRRKHIVWSRPCPRTSWRRHWPVSTRPTGTVWGTVAWLPWIKMDEVKGETSTWSAFRVIWSKNRITWTTTVVPFTLLQPSRRAWETTTAEIQKSRSWLWQTKLQSWISSYDQI